MWHHCCPWFAARIISDTTSPSTTVAAAPSSTTNGRTTAAGGRGGGPGGSFMGNPVLVSATIATAGFPGTGTDGAIYHFRWTGAAGHTPLESLGGLFQSDPSVVTQSSGRIDVAAANSEPHLIGCGMEPIQVGISVISVDLLFGDLEHHARRELGQPLSVPEP
ncbi:hypothetical protein DL764_010443 [Monosporascus ibericus]|uniref:Uncharacterized protein n=1 Tax=Monosporascus ibericus TaxID=155417 RepID=A0A4Q4SRJ2_9PEZI|nr:hypothetical protein DL764_010443 [Monosporascus ibericus]